QKAFLDKAESFNLTEEQIETFLKNFRDITYDRHNISNYINLVLYFQYDISEKFIFHIIKEYVLNKPSLSDKISKFKIIVDKIETFSEMWYWQSNEQLSNISKYVAVKTVDLCYSNNVTNDGIKDLTNIHTLKLNWNKTITDEGIKNLTNVH